MKERVKNLLFVLVIVALPLLVAACNSGGAAPGY
jgi:predicted small secreted protein